MVRVIVTGAAGFIGSHLTERLLAEGAGVSAIDNLSTFIRTVSEPSCSGIMNVRSGKTHSINRIVELLGGDGSFIPKRPGEPARNLCLCPENRGAPRLEATVSLETVVNTMLENIAKWCDAPVWDAASINDATTQWFSHLDRASRQIPASINEIAAAQA